ncbi:MAG: P-loop NTPase [Myxococcales bacterium]|nr:P-loop NTPase [Myxococcales bacterium]
MNGSDSASRVVTLRQFCSAKGGVGKSTLAVATAKLLARRGKSTVFLLDTDHTGTSLADGLNLRAPRVATTSGGAIDFSQPADGWWSRRETEQLRLSRDRDSTEESESRPQPPLFLADFLLGDETARRPGHVQSYFWRLGDDEHHDGVHYLPASPLQLDLQLALRWLDQSKVANWTRRLTWLIDTIVRNVAGDIDIVVDSSPGRFGLAVEVLRLQHHLTNLNEYVGLPPNFPRWSATTTGDGRTVKWRTHPMVVTSADRNDLWSVLDWWVSVRQELPQLHLVANRVGQTDRPLAVQARERLAQLDMPASPTISVIPLIPSLSAIFSKTYDLAKFDELRAIDHLLEGKS